MKPAKEVEISDFDDWVFDTGREIAIESVFIKKILKKLTIILRMKAFDNI